MEPHLQNSEDLIKRASTPNDMDLLSFIFKSLSAHQRDLKLAGEKISQLVVDNFSLIQPCRRPAPSSSCPKRAESDD